MHHKCAVKRGLAVMQFAAIPMGKRHATVSAPKRYAPVTIANLSAGPLPTIIWPALVSVVPKTINNRNMGPGAIARVPMLFEP